MSHCRLSTALPAVDYLKQLLLHLALHWFRSYLSAKLLLGFELALGQQCSAPVEFNHQAVKPDLHVQGALILQSLLPCHRINQSWRAKKFVCETFERAFSEVGQDSVRPPPSNELNGDGVKSIARQGSCTQRAVKFDCLTTRLSEGFELLVAVSQDVKGARESSVTDARRMSKISRNLLPSNQLWRWAGSEILRSVTE